MADKKTDSKVFYIQISEDRIREIIREEITEMRNTHPDKFVSMERPDEKEWLSAEEWSKRIQDSKERINRLNKERDVSITGNQEITT